MDVIVLISIYLSSLLFNIQFEKEFKIEIQNAIKIQNKISSDFRSRVEYYNGDYEICSALIFPEIIRFSIIRNKIENIIVKTFYRLHGSKVSDLSVGLFQMKPSFIEKLEKEVLKYKELEQFFFIRNYPENSDIKTIRELRFDRLIELQWQIDYLICFTKLMDLKHLNNTYELKLNNKKDKIALYSSAYNSGYWDDVEKIKYYQSKSFFPGGLKLYINKYNYSDISVYYYENFINKNN